MDRSLNRGWLWVSTYAVYGSFCVAYALCAWIDLAPDRSFLLSLALSSFMGTALVSRYAGGLAITEGVVGAVIVGVLNALPPAGILASRLGPQWDASLSTQAVSLFVITLSFALAGGRLGRVWSRRRVYEGRGPGAVVMASFVLVGALACHVSIVVAFADVSHSLAVFLCFVSLFLTPAFAGAALQLGQHESVEGQVGYGLALIALGVLVFMAVQVHSVGSLSLVAVAFVGVGVIFYSLTLPGVLAVRSTKSWRHRWNHVPAAVVIHRSQAIPQSEYDPSV